MSEARKTLRIQPDTRQPAPELGRRATQKIDSILDAALQVFTETGYAGATIDAIAQRGGISRAGIYTYFRSKRDLLIALGARGITELQALAARFSEIDVHDRDAVRSWTSDILDFYARDSTLSFIWRDASRSDEALRTEGLFQMRSVWRSIGSPVTSADASEDRVLIRGMIIDSAVELAWYFSERMGADFDRAVLADELAALITGISGQEPSAAP